MKSAQVEELIQEHASEVGKIVGSAIIIFVVVLAWFETPLLEYANLQGLQFGGAAAAFTASFTYTTVRLFVRLNWGWFVQLCVCIAAAVLSTYVLNGVESDASSAASANQKRCLAIQFDMLSSHPRMANAVDAFQALKCRPQGSDYRIYVPPTDRERSAGKPLPWGGYPPATPRPR